MLAVSFKPPESAKRLIFEAAKENPTFIAPQLRIELERFAAHQNLFMRHQATHLKTFFQSVPFPKQPNRKGLKF